MKLISKGQNLSQLSGDKYFKEFIPPLLLIRPDTYLKRKKYFLNFIKKKFKNKIIIRSSSDDEDQLSKSNAGKYDSYLNLNNDDYKNINDSIIKIIQKYLLYSTNGGILIQEMITNSKISGVLTTTLTNGNKNYIEINYSRGKKTNIVTSGKKGSKNLILFKSLKIPKRYEFFSKLIALSKKLSTVFKNDSLDIEFSITKENKIKIFQVRPLIIKKIHTISLNEQNIFLSALKKKIDKLKKKHDFLYGNTTYFGVMPDWNPAEIIGMKPKNLSYTMYKELITNQIWADQRANYGFEKVIENPLMIRLFGTPYIDMRVNFNSWLPRKLSNDTKGKLVNLYLNIFKKNKEFHDKIEFKIIYSCFVLNTSKKLKDLKYYGFSSNEIYSFKKELKEITRISINNYYKDILKIQKLPKMQLKVINSNLDIIQKIYYLNKNCKLLGTLPFAGIARNAFIAIEFINSLVDLKIITNDHKEDFLNSISNISSKFQQDFKNLNKKKFLDIYGHLRPNTYDIESKNYREAYSDYFSKNDNSDFTNSKKTTFKLNISNKSKLRLNNFFIVNKLPFKNENEFFKYIASAIEYREYSKFIFTKSISLIFEQLIKLGNRLKINRSELSHLDYSLILNKFTELNTDSLSKILKKNIIYNKKEYIKNFLIPLPEVINNSNDIYYYENAILIGNYIGTQTVIGEIIFFDKKTDNYNLEGKVVLIRNADPGYDFIFNKKIKALITCYGGANSHMAIRCSEFNLTGIIGIGEIKFRELINQKKVYIDPIKKIIKKI